VLRLLSRADLGSNSTSASEVEKIVLNGCAKLTDRSVAAISRKCPRLRHLELRQCPNLTDQALVHLAHRCQDLEHLDFSG
jgi:F-box/leucine-rich repeat protein 7